MITYYRGEELGSFVPDGKGTLRNGQAGVPDVQQLPRRTRNPECHGEPVLILPASVKPSQSNL